MGVEPRAPAAFRGEQPARCGRSDRRRTMRAARDPRRPIMSAMCWSAARNLLCVRLDNAGDVLMTTPAIRALKRSCPGRRITLLASRAGGAVARHVPEIDAVIRYDAPWMKNNATQDGSEDLATYGRLGAARFDAAVIFTVY